MEKYKSHFVLLALYLLMVGALTVYMLRVKSDYDNQNVRKDNPGFNNYCQRKGLSKLDQSVCFGSMNVDPHAVSSKKDDTKHKRLFLLYSDGTPYGYYKSMIEDPKWTGMLVPIPAHALGPMSSGPIFRGTSLGRVDGDFLGDMSMIDNIFGQIYKVAGIQFWLHLNYYYPVWHNLQNETFARVERVPEVEDETFNSFCKVKSGQGYIYTDHNDTYGCTDIWECNYPSLEDAEVINQARYQELLAKIKKGNTSELEACLDKEVGQTGGLFMFSANTDIHAHTYTMLSKKVIETHATMRANFEFTAEYLLQKYPDCLVAVFSDHGHGENIVVSEWADHGFEQGDNRGFMMLFSPKFKTKELRKVTPIQDHITLYTHFAMLMEGVNIPALTERLPPMLFENDPIEKLRALRLKEMQLDYLLSYQSAHSQEYIGNFLEDRKIDTSVTIAQLIENFGVEKTTKFLEEYEERVQSIMSKSYIDKMAELLGNWYSSKPITYLVVLMSVGFIFYAWKHQLKMISVESRRAQVFATLILAIWYTFHVITFTLNEWDIVLAPLFLFLAGISLCFVKNEKFSICNLDSLAALDFLDEKTVELLRYTCFGMAISTVVVRVSFNYILMRTHLVKLWLYALAPEGAFVGIVLVIFWTLYLVRYAWKTEEDDQNVDHSMHQGLDREIEQLESSLPDRDQQISLKKKVIKRFRMFQTFLVIGILIIVVVYEQKLYRQQTLNHGSDGVWMVYLLYWCVGLSFIASFFGQPEFSKVILIPMQYINMSFWHNHWTRISFGLLFMPVLVWTFFRYRAIKAEGNEAIRRTREAILFAFLLIAQFGFYRANKEEYALYVNQRAFWRQPIYHPDTADFGQMLHILNIKACSAILLLQIIHAISRQRSLIEMNFLVLFHVCFLMIECFFQIKLGVKWVNFWLMSIIHLILPMVYQAFAWIRELVQYLLRLWYKKRLAKHLTKPSDASSQRIELAHSSVSPDMSTGDL